MNAETNVQLDSFEVCRLFLIKNDSADTRTHSEEALVDKTVLLL